MFTLCSSNPDAREKRRLTLRMRSAEFLSVRLIFAEGSNVRMCITCLVKGGKMFVYNKYEV